MRAAYYSVPCLLPLAQVSEARRTARCGSIPKQGRWLGQVVRGYFAYHDLPTNTRAIGAFRWDIVRLWRQTVKRQSPRARAS